MNPIVSLTSVNNDTYQITGSLNGTQNLWRATGGLDQLDVHWNLTLHRIFGWYGQQDLENFDEDTLGMLQWNPYAHDSLVEGTIQIGSETIAFSTVGNSFRAYADMNWGREFPDPPSHRSFFNTARLSKTDTSYSWTWFDVCIPTSANAEDDIAIAGGWGNAETGFPFYTLEGGFVDVRLGSSVHVGIRLGHAWNKGPYPIKWSTTNDGDVKEFSVTRLNWVNFTDEFGADSIPLGQQIALETSTYRVELTFITKASQYNRLLYPFEKLVFSDFEAVGASVLVQVWKKGAQIISTTSSAGGLEYGAQVAINLGRPSDSQ
jgi:hypothetical protein